MRRALIAGGVMLGVLLPAAQASAHPLGNFTVNHYDGVTLTATSVTDHAIVDAAEIPTAQARSSVDRNHDGHIDAQELAAYAGGTCKALARAVTVSVEGRPVPVHVGDAMFGYRPGAAGLSTSRLECTLVAPLRVSVPTEVTLADGFEGDRVGWHEITATTAGVHLHDSPVPQRSVSDELRHYPNDLLSSPLDVRSARFTVLPGAGVSTVSRGLAQVPGAGPLARAVGDLDRTLGALAGRRHLTVGIGALAVLVSLLLGAAHAALPGHGKTVMAAYLAGKRGTRRDAAVVGATVTLTHTAGVLLLGLALSLSTSLAGERVTGELGLASGALIVAVGAGLFASAVRQRRHAPGRDLRHDGHGHDHDHHGHDHDHDHDGHGHDHDHDGHGHVPAGSRPGRAMLVGMGVAGGLVPSPSALVVLLGAVSLGRTGFGVALVLTYGIGMAATLTAAGLLLVTAAGRWRARPRLTAMTGRASALLPATTSVLVVVVGLGLAARSLATL